MPLWASGHVTEGQRRVSREWGSCAQDHRPFLHQYSRLYKKNSPASRFFPPTHEMKESMVDGVRGWQNFSHAWVGDHEKKTCDETERGCRITNCGYQDLRWYSSGFQSYGSKTPRTLIIPWNNNILRRLPWVIRQKLYTKSSCFPECNFPVASPIQSTLAFPYLSHPPTWISCKTLKILAFIIQVMGQLFTLYT